MCSQRETPRIAGFWNRFCPGALTEIFKFGAVASRWWLWGMLLGFFLRPETHGQFSLQNIFDQCFPHASAAAKSLESCPTLCDPMDSRPPGSPVPGILQARTLEWVAISFSNAWKWKMKVKSLSCVWLLATPWTAAHQAPPSTGFSRQDYWSGVPLPSPHNTC